MHEAEPVQIKGRTEYKPRIKQYPLKPDAEKGIEPVINELKQAGIIIPCPDSPCNTPIFPVKKDPPSLAWRLVQDLRAINEAVQQRAPNVPNPHTLLNSIRPEGKYFSVIDLSNAFWSIPLSKESQKWFTFTFKGEKLTFTKLPQGYCESPTIFSQCISNCLSKFHPPKNSQILVYVDDILVVSNKQDDCKVDTLALLKFLAETGNKVSKNKLQLWTTEVKYIGHTLSAQGRTVNAERKQAILKAPRPETKKQMMSFLGLCNYCRAWLLDYAVTARPLLELIYSTPMMLNDKITWTDKAEEAFIKLKQALAGTTVLALPDYSKTFIQTVDCKK